MPLVRTSCILNCASKGPHMRPHRALAAVLARELRHCRAEVGLERTVVELTKQDGQGNFKDAILDLVVTFPGAVQAHYIDVTIRCPHAERYEHAGHAPGEAASTAVREKRAHYGSSVLTVAMETYGRFAAEIHRALEVLASQAGYCARDQWAVPRLVPAWRSALERVVLFAVADIDLLALGRNVVAAEARLVCSGAAG